MTNIKAWIAVGILGVGLFFCGFLFGKSQVAEKLLGAIGTNPIENYVPAILYNEGYYSNLPIQTTSTVTSSGSQTGTSGTAFTFIQGNTCTATTSTAVFTATTTKTHNCAATGALAGDKVIVQLNQSGSAFGALTVVSSTVTESNFFHFDLLNLTGVATSSYPQSTTTVKYWIYR